MRKRDGSSFGNFMASDFASLVQTGMEPTTRLKQVRNSLEETLSSRNVLEVSSATGTPVTTTTCTPFLRLLIVHCHTELPLL